MKKLFLCVICFFITVAASLASELYLTWPAVSDTAIKGYIVYFTVADTGTTGTEEYVKNVGLNTRVSLNDLHVPFNKKVTFYVTAWKECGESARSVPFTYTRESFTPPVDKLPDSTGTTPPVVAKVDIVDA